MSSSFAKRVLSRALLSSLFTIISVVGVIAAVRADSIRASRRGLPISVIVTDFFHWTRMGDWKFDPAYWPDPAAMVKELEALGVKLMVSVWPAPGAKVIASSPCKKMLPP